MKKTFARNSPWFNAHDGKTNRLGRIEETRPEEAKRLKYKELPLPIYREEDDQ